MEKPWINGRPRDVRWMLKKWMSIKTILLEKQRKLSLSVSLMIARQTH
jgi:hypothetical protein